MNIGNYNPPHIKGIDKKTYQILEINKETGEVSAETPWYGKILSILGYETHLNKKIVQQLVNSIKTNTRDLEKSSSKLKVQSIQSMQKLRAALTAIKNAGIKSDVRIDDCAIYLKGLESYVSIYKTTEEGSRNACQYVTKKALDRFIDTNDPSLKKCKVKIKELSQSIRLLHLLKVYDGHIPSDILKKEHKNQNVKLDYKQLFEKINTQIKEVVHNYFNIGYWSLERNFMDSNSVAELRERLETFRDSGSYPTEKSSILGTEVK